MKKKVLLVVKSLSDGGSERCSAILSLMLEKHNYDVSFVILDNKISYNYFGKCFVLNDEKVEKNIKSRFTFFRDFRRYVMSNHFDFIIDFRGRKSMFRELLIYNFIYKKVENIIYTIHLPELSYYITHPFFLFKNIYKKAFKVIVVSEAINEKVKKEYLLENTKLIYNAIDISKIEELKDEDIVEEDKYILIVGRMEDGIKQIDKLIDIYPQTNLKENNIKLFIMGSGILAKDIELNVKARRLDTDIRFLSFQDNPYKYMSKAKFLVLCSKIEGFPYVILETLACGTPVVSFDCETGPSEMIKNEVNGLLVDNQNFLELTKAINRMVEDTSLYNLCKGNAMASVQQYDIDIIAKQWTNVLREES